MKTNKKELDLLLEKRKKALNERQEYSRRIQEIKEEIENYN